MVSPVVQVRLPEDILEQVKAQAVLHKTTVSQFLRNCVLQRLVELEAVSLVPDIELRELPVKELQVTESRQAICKCGGHKHPVKDRCLRCNQKLVA
jgi:hypothetical protein